MINIRITELFSLINITFSFSSGKWFSLSKSWQFPLSIRMLSTCSGYLFRDGNTKEFEWVWHVETTGSILVVKWLIEDVNPINQRILRAAACVQHYFKTLTHALLESLLLLRHCHLQNHLWAYWMLLKFIYGFIIKIHFCPHDWFACKHITNTADIYENA